MFVGFGQKHVPFRKIWLFVTDAQIAILCGIGQASSFDDEKRGEVESGGSWLRRKGRGPFKITPKGQKVLTDRGARLNES